MTSGIEPTTSRLIAQLFNQLRHRVPLFNGTVVQTCAIAVFGNCLVFIYGNYFLSCAAINSNLCSFFQSKFINVIH
jgi:hypothetical protein